MSFVIVDDFFWCETICKVCETHIHTNKLVPTLPSVTFDMPTTLMRFALARRWSSSEYGAVGWGCGFDGLGQMMLRELM
jgi:hypothetical protein